MFDYPSEYPWDESEVLEKALEGDRGAPGQVLHACWVMEGYALSQCTPHEATAPPKAEAWTPDEVAKSLKSHKANKGAGRGRKAMNIDWQKVLASVYSVVQQILGGGLYQTTAPAKAKEPDKPA
jgi:hypothetical protein